MAASKNRLMIRCGNEATWACLAWKAQFLAGKATSRWRLTLNDSGIRPAWDLPLPGSMEPRHPNRTLFVKRRLTLDYMKSRSCCTTRVNIVPDNRYFLLRTVGASCEFDCIKILIKRSNNFVFFSCPSNLILFICCIRAGQ